MGYNVHDTPCRVGSVLHFNDIVGDDATGNDGNVEADQKSAFIDADCRETIHGI